MENPNLEFRCHTWVKKKNPCQRLIPLASRAAEYEDCYLLVEEALHRVSKQGEEEETRGTPNVNASKSSVEESFSLTEPFKHVAGLKEKEKARVDQKKKNVRLKNCRRRRKQTRIKQTILYSTKENESFVPDSQAYESLNSFTQLIKVHRRLLSLSLNIAAYILNTW